MASELTLTFFAAWLIGVCAGATLTMMRNLEPVFAAPR